LVIGILWWLKAVPSFSRQFGREETARQYETVIRKKSRATGNERILRAEYLRLEPKSNRSNTLLLPLKGEDSQQFEPKLNCSVFLSKDNETIGSVVGTYEMGRIWVTATDSDERVLFQLQCANPGAWYRYGYKRKVRWLVAESDGGQAIGVIELRPTFLGRFKWRIGKGTESKFGQVKAGVEWSRIMVAPAGALAAAIIPNLEHHATVSMRSNPMCAASWSGQSAVLTFVHGEWDIAERKLAMGVAVLLACCPNYYRHA
jgi:hypothetical protein